MSHDVAGEHCRDEVMEQMKVGAADCATGDFDDGVARILDFRIGDGIAADVFFSVPNESFHLKTLTMQMSIWCLSRASRAAGALSFERASVHGVAMKKK